MLAMTSKDNYEWMINHVKHVVCKYFVEHHQTNETELKWTLGNALKQKERLWPGELVKVEEILEDIAKRNGSMEELTKFLILDQDYSSVYELLDIRRESTIPTQIQTLSFTTNEKHSDIIQQITKTIEKEPIGYSLKGAEIRMRLTRNKLFKILAKMKDLETLILNIELESGFISSNAPRGKGYVRVPIIDDVIDEKREVFDERNIFIPIFKNLKTLKVENYLNYTDNVHEILGLFPNLEHLFLVFNYTTIHDTIFESICSSCPKLKTLHISNHGANSQTDTEVSDDFLLNFLEKQSNIEIIDLQTLTCVTAPVLKKFGDFTMLRKFSAQIYSQSDISYFGGTPNPNLEYLDIGPGYDIEDEIFENLVTSLKTAAPNLKDFELCHLKSEKYRKIAQLYVNTLETLSLSPSTLDLVPLCINLKRVLIKKLKMGDKIGINLNVTELVEICDNHEVYPTLAESFPNLKIIESCDGFTVLNFLLENNNCWPQLEYIKFDLSPEPVLLETLISQRPNIVIEFMDGNNDTQIMPLSSPQSFYYQWLVKDIQNRCQN